MSDHRKEITRLMREDFDPTPAGWEGREWDDNAEDVADKIAALFTSPAAPSPAQPAPYTCKHGCERDQIMDRLAAAEARLEEARGLLTRLSAFADGTGSYGATTSHALCAEIVAFLARTEVPDDRA